TASTKLAARRVNRPVRGDNRRQDCEGSSVASLKRLSDKLRDSVPLSLGGEDEFPINFLPMPGEEIHVDKRRHFLSGNRLDFVLNVHKLVFQVSCFCFPLDESKGFSAYRETIS